MSTLLSAKFEKRFPKCDPIEFEIELALDHFGITMLLGPSGCGKTTALRCLAGLLTPDMGRISVGKFHWFDLSQKINLIPQERDIGFMFQDLALFPHLNVEENIGFGLIRQNAKQRRERVAELMNQLEITGLEKHYPNQISGGEQQRVALARAVARRPKLLLLDEPLSALDTKTRDRVRPQLKQILEAFRIPVIMVTHDRQDALELGDHLIVMDEGKILEKGPVHQVFAHPQTRKCAKLLGMENLLNGEVLQGENGQSMVAIGSIQLPIPSPKNFTGPILISIWAEEVRIDSQASIKLQAIVKKIILEGPMTRLGLDCGFPLVARVLLSKEDRGSIRHGQTLPVSINPDSIHLMRDSA